MLKAINTCNIRHYSDHESVRVKEVTALFIKRWSK